MALGTVDPGRRATIAPQEAVRQLPSTIARLAYLSALRDPNSGVYAHPVASRGAARLEIDRLLRAMHEAAFSEWLKYSLEKQKADLDLYFSSLDCSKATALQTWLRTESYHSLVPASASSVERQWFFSDLEALLRLMANGLGLAIGLSNGAEQGAPDKPLLTVKELSRWLGVSCSALRLWAEPNLELTISPCRQAKREPPQAARPGACGGAPEEQSEDLTAAIAARPRTDKTGFP